MADELRCLSVGAGVDTTVVFLKSLRGEIAPYDLAVFADTHAEPREVYEHLDRLSAYGEEHGLPIHRVSAGSLTERMLDPNRRDGIQIPAFIVRPKKVPVAWTPCSLCGGTGESPLREAVERGEYPDLAALYADELDELERCSSCAGDGRVPTEWREEPKPGLLRRQCTERFKSRPVYKWLNQVREGRPVVLALGIAWDEMERMKPPQRKWVTNEYPLVDLRMDRAACKRWLAEAGWSAPRSACVYCPYHADAEWRRLRDEHPADWEEACRVDDEMRRVHSERIGAGATSLTGTPYVHRTLIPLREVDLRTIEDHGQGSLFSAGCEEGWCGL